MLLWLSVIKANNVSKVEAAVAISATDVAMLQEVAKVFKFSFKLLNNVLRLIVAF